MFSRRPMASRPSTSLPTWASVCSTKPAKTSIRRSWNARSSWGMLSHAAMFFARGVSFVSAGIQPSCFCRSKVCSRMHVPAVRRTCPCTCPPTPRNTWCGPWAPPGAQYMKKGLSGAKARWRLSQVMRLVRHVLGQVVLLVVGRLDGVRVLDEARLPLRGLAGEEAVEVVEAVAGGPVGERAHRGRLVGGRVVPLAEGGGLVAVVAQDLGHGGGRHRHDAGVAVPVHRALGDGAGADALVVAPGEQRGARGRADRGGVEPVVADAVVGEAAEGRRVDRAAERVGQAEAHVVEQDDQDVGRVLRQVVRLDPPLVLRLLQRPPRDAGRRCLWKRQDGAVGRGVPGRLRPGTPGEEREADGEHGQVRGHLHALHGLHSSCSGAYRGGFTTM